jgi:hypothetical protein
MERYKKDLELSGEMETLKMLSVVLGMTRHAKASVESAVLGPDQDQQTTHILTVDQDAEKLPDRKGVRIIPGPKLLVPLPSEP